MTVAQLDQSLTVDEYGDWLAFYTEEPFGEVRADLRSAVVALTIARTMGGKGRRHTLMDFMPIVAAQRTASNKARPNKSLENEVLHAGIRAGFGRLGLRHVKIKRS